MRQSEYKRRYDPDLGRYVKKHIYTGEIYGEGMSDIFKKIGNNILRKATKSATEKAAKRTGNYAGKKGGDRIFNLLMQKDVSKPNISQPNISQPDILPLEQNESTYENINERINQMLSGGKLRRSKFI